MGITETSFTLYTIYNPDCGLYVHGLVCWTAQQYGNAPLVGLNTTGEWLSDSTAVVPPNVVLLIRAPIRNPMIQLFAGLSLSPGRTGSPDFSISSIPAPRALSDSYSAMARSFTAASSWVGRHSIPIRLVAGRISISPRFF